MQGFGEGGTHTAGRIGAKVINARSKGNGGSIYNDRWTTIPTPKAPLLCTTGTVSVLPLFFCLPNPDASDVVF